MRILGLLASVIAAMLLIGACGGGNDDDSGANGGTGEAPELTENDLAEAMLLVLGDFPAGEEWEYEPPSDDDEDDEPSPFDRCGQVNEEGKIGTADGGDFSRRSASEISQDIRIFDNVDSLERNLDDIEDRADCMTDLVNEGALDTEDAAFSDFEMQRVEYREFGDQSRAYRVKMTVTDLDPEDPLDPFSIYADTVFVAIDTVGMSIIATDAFKPYDQDEVGRIVALGVEKVRDTLANDPVGSD